MAGLGDRVSSHYGFGAARLAVCGEPHLAPSESLSGDLDHLREAGRDFIWSAAPALALASLVLLSLLISVTQDASDRSDIQMLVWRDYPVHEEPLAPEPEPVPEPEPIPEPPKKKPVDAQAPKPLPKKPPPPVRRAKPKPPPQKAAPKPPPRPQIDALAQRKPVAPPPSKRSRDPAPSVRRQMVKIDPAQTPAIRQVADPAPRSARFGAVRAAKTTHARPTVAPAPIAARPASAPPAPRPTRSRKSAPRPAATRPGPQLAFAGSAPKSLESRAPAAPAARRARPSPAPASRSRAPALRLDAPAAATPRALPKPAPKPSRSRPGAPAAPSAASRSNDPRLAGVPLASLAACSSDAEEESLKRRVLAAVTTQRECVSAAGIYRFVETKNLNAFLMWVDRARSRGAGDRCVELRHALDCLR